MFENIKRELIYFWYYTDVQLRQIFKYYIIGVLVGSFISVYGKQKITLAVEQLSKAKNIYASIIIASFLGILSPLCMFGTIPIVVALSKKGLKESIILSFMMSSILLNPQLLFFTKALGTNMMIMRFIICFIMGTLIGIVKEIFFKSANFLTYECFYISENHDTHKNIIMRYILNVYRNLKATFLWFLVGIAITSLFNRYVDKDAFSKIFVRNSGFGTLMASALGVPLYACGGGTIPLIREFILQGMPLGSVAAFMITGPATKWTNLAALKTVMKFKFFMFYFIYVIVYAFIVGLIINLVI